MHMTKLPINITQVSYSEYLCIWTLSPVSAWERIAHIASAIEYVD